MDSEQFLRSTSIGKWSEPVWQGLPLLPGRWADSMVAVVALGANLPSPVGSPAHTLCAAVEAMRQAGLRPIARSPLFESAPVPPSGQPPFLNAVVAVETDRPPRDVLSSLHRIEGSLGRRRDARWQARCLDLDVISHGRRIVPEAASWQSLAEARDTAAYPDLILPHPRAHRRRFVLAPLAWMARDWRHPVFGKAAQDLPGFHAADQPCREVAPVAD